ncbi:hypothetical protein HDZ31DRAFT_70853 [Schizophyllum fasciatum]
MMRRSVHHTNPPTQKNAPHPDAPPEKEGPPVGSRRQDDGAHAPSRKGSRQTHAVGDPGRDSMRDTGMQVQTCDIPYRCPLTPTERSVLIFCGTVAAPVICCAGAFRDTQRSSGLGS